MYKSLTQALSKNISKNVVKRTYHSNRPTYEQMLAIDLITGLTILGGASFFEYVNKPSSKQLQEQENLLKSTTKETPGLK